MQGPVRHWNEGFRRWYVSLNEYKQPIFRALDTVLIYSEIQFKSKQAHKIKIKKQKPIPIILRYLHLFLQQIWVQCHHLLKRHR